MTVQQWQRVKEAFEEARHLSASGEHDFLRGLSSSDPEIVEDLRALLVAYRKSESFLTTGSLIDAAQANLDATGLTLIGSRLGPYRVSHLIGLGGMGGGLSRRSCRWRI